MATTKPSSIPILDLSWARSPTQKPHLLEQLRSALFDVGFLYITNHNVPQSTIDNLTSRLPALFNLPEEKRAALGKLNSPHFLGYNGFAEEVTLGKKDLREQFDFATELPAVWQDKAVSNGHINGMHANADETRDFSQLYWRLRGPNQWPNEKDLPGFRQAFIDYHDAVQQLSYKFVRLIEEAFGIPVGTFDHFFGRQDPMSILNGTASTRGFLPPQHRIKLLKYPPSEAKNGGQGVGAHKDSSGWLTFLYQVSNEPGLEVLSADNEWLPIKPIEGSFVVNFGNPFEAATEGAVKATTHRVIAPGPESNTRYSIPFFQGVPLDMTVSEIRSFIPEEVRRLRQDIDGREQVSSFLDPRWDSLGESSLRKWIRSHPDVGTKFYGQEIVDYYTTAH